MVTSDVFNIYGTIEEGGTWLSDMDYIFTLHLLILRHPFPTLPP